MSKRCLPVMVVTMLIIAAMGLGMCSAAVITKVPIDPVKPIINAPTDLTATTTNGEISLTWKDNSDNEGGFEVERKSGTTFAVIAGLGAGVTSFTDSNVTAGTSYVYRVRAISDTAVSAYSNEAAVTMPTRVINPNLQVIPKPKLSALPAVPAELQAVPASTSEIKLTWVDQSFNENGFYLERKQDNSDFSQIAVIPKDATQYIDTGLQEGITYTYRICAYNSFGSSDYSNESSSKTFTTIYSQPAPKIIKYRIGQSSYTLNGVSYPMDVAPIIFNSRTYLPIRYVAEPLGAAIDWNAAQQKAIIVFNDITVEMVLNSNIAWVDGVETKIDSDPLVTPIVQNDRVLVPVAFVATSLGCEVTWEGDIQEVTLIYPKQ